MAVSRFIRRVTMGVAVGAVALAAAAQETGPDVELENLGKELVKKRARIDALSGDVQQKGAELRDRVRNLGLQKADLERQFAAIKLELGEVESNTARERQETARKAAGRNSLKPLVLRQIELLRAHVLRTLPFKRSERVAEFDRLKAQVDEGEIPSDGALTKLWSLVEDEFRLTRESGLYRQSIELGGESVLSEVARLGMVLLYFKTFDDRVGMAVPAGEGAWSFHLVADPEGRKRILGLFDSLKKHLRQGYYELPNPYRPADAPAPAPKPRPVEGQGEGKQDGK